MSDCNGMACLLDLSNRTSRSRIECHPHWIILFFALLTVEVISLSLGGSRSISSILHNKLVPISYHFLSQFFSFTVVLS